MASGIVTNCHGRYVSDAGQVTTDDGSCGCCCPAECSQYVVVEEITQGWLGGIPASACGTPATPLGPNVVLDTFNTPCSFDTANGDPGAGPVVGVSYDTCTGYWTLECIMKDILGHPVIGLWRKATQFGDAAGTYEAIPYSVDDTVPCSLPATITVNCYP